jgi:hypothetical protein
VITPCGGSPGVTGIQFDTFPQSGTWLYVETTGARVSGFGIELNASSGYWFHGAGASTIDATAGLTLKSTGGNVDVSATAAGKKITLTAAAEAKLAAKKISLDATGVAGGSVIVSSNDLISMGCSGASGFRVSTVGGVGTDGPIEFDIGSGQKFVIKDSSGNPLLEVRDNGTFHIKTGAAWVADL